MADAAVFEEWVSIHSPALLRTAVLLAGSRESGEDLLQAALQKTYLRWSHIEDIDAAAAYTRTVMTHLATRWWRRRWRGEVPTEQVPEARTGDAFEAVDDRDRLRRELAKLPRQQRAVVVLRYYEDRSEQEVAATLGVSVGTVKAAAHVGLGRLRSAMCPAVIDLTDAVVSSRGNPPLVPRAPEPQS
ncbi:MAG TPA: SigE family RNA polymerase sigma factor [Mycobacteriales bacterium]|nr:SigE family RNA polymerase sigma factor [Mycobacteriales bacterium]